MFGIGSGSGRGLEPRVGQEESGRAESAAAMLESSGSKKVEGKGLYREYNEKREGERACTEKLESSPFLSSWVNAFYEANCNDGTSERRSMTDVREDF